jgi:uncharacterized protein
MTTLTEHRPAEADHSAPPPPGRRGMPAGDVLLAMLVCLLLWTFLFGPELKRASEKQPIGARRSVSLALLAPFVAVSNLTQITDVTDAVERSLGRDPASDGEVFGAESLPPIPPSGPGTGTKPPTHDTRLREPTGENRLRVAVVGDSLADGVGYYAERVFKPFFVDVLRQGRISTGLARPDYFNWQANMQLIVERYRPDLTIVILGENDNQSLQAPPGGMETPIGSFEWPPAYRARVERFARIATSDGGHVIWIGLPVERDESRWEFIRRQNDIYRLVAEDLPNVEYVDSWDMFDKADGGYTAYYRDGNEVELVRESDGVHFTATGYTILMEQVGRVATGAFDLDPKTYET